MRRLTLVLALLLAGCENSNKPPVVLTTTATPAPPPPPIAQVQPTNYDVETVIWDGWASPNYCHGVVADWLKKHPNRTLVQVVPWSVRFGTGGISFISTSTR